MPLQFTYNLHNTYILQPFRYFPLYPLTCDGADSSQVFLCGKSSETTGNQDCKSPRWVAAIQSGHGTGHAEENLLKDPRAFDTVCRVLPG